MTIRSVALILVTSLLALSACAPPEPVETEEQEAVRATIDQLFDGMRAGDSTAIRGAFHENGELHRALGPRDTSTVSSTPLEGFIESAGQSHERVWDERIWDVEIQVDGPLASAWVPYAFYLGDELSHCGVNSMQLVQTADGWKIYQLTDFSTQDCDIPADVQK